MDNETLKRLQKEEFMILQELDRVCKKHKIEYALAFGTALGAVRHKGFIPWDDDIDVSMTIENYKKFAEVAPKELSDKMFFQSLDTEKYMYLFWNKIRKNNTFSSMIGQEKFPVHLGICIDVFPLSKYPIDKSLQKKHYKYMKYVIILLQTELYKWKFNKAEGRKKVIYKILSLIPNVFRKVIVKKLLKYVLDYDGEYDNYVNYSGLFSRVVLFPKDIVENVKKIEFEGKKFPVFKNYDEYLTILYGDYMKFPPKEKQKVHGDLIIKFEEELK